MTNVLGSTRSITVELPDTIQSLAFAPDGLAIAASTDAATFLVDVTTGESRRLGTCGGTVAWGPCGVVAVSHGRAKRFSVGVSAKKASGAALLARSTRDEVEVFGEDGVALRTLPIESWVVTVGGGTLAVFGNGVVHLLDPATGKERTRVDAPHASYIALSPDGSRLLATGRDGSWEGPVTGPLQWYAESGQPAHAGAVFAIGGTVFRPGEVMPLAYSIAERIAFSPAMDRACLARDQHLQIVAFADLTATRPIVGPREDLRTIVVDDAGGRIAASDEHGLLTCVWRLDDTSLVSAFRTGSRAITWAPDGTLLAGGNGISVWDAETGRRRACVPLHDLEEIGQLLVRGDRVFARGRWQVAILDAALNRVATFGPWPLDEHGSAGITAIDVSPDGAIVYVGRRDKPTLAIPVAGGEPTELAEASTIGATNEFVALSHYSEAVLVTRGGEQRPIDDFNEVAAVGDAVICAHDQRVTLHAWSGPRFEAQYRDSVRALAASTARPRFYSGGGTTWIAERHLDDGRLRRVFASGGGGKVTSLAFDPTGDRLAIGEYQGRLHVWSLSGTPRRIGLLDGTSLQPEGTIREPGALGTLNGLAFPGDLVACARTAMIWGTQDLTAIGTTEPRTFGEYVSTVSRDGTRFVSGGDWGHDVVVFDASGELFRAPGSEGRDRFMDISDDGGLLLIGGVTEASTEITVYGRSGERVGTLRVDGRVGYAGFSSRGDVLGWMEEKGPFFRWARGGDSVEKWCDSPVASRWNLSSFARGGGRLALCGETITIVDEGTGARHAVIPMFARHSATAVAMSDDGRRVAIGSWHGIVRVYDLTAPMPRCIAELCATEDAGWWAASPDDFTHVRGDAATRLWSEP